DKLPLLNYVRTNGEFRVFPILCFCITAGFSLDKLYVDDHFRQTFLKITKLIWCLIFVLIVVIAFSFYQDIQNVLAGIISTPTFILKVKWLLTNAPFIFFLFIAALLGFITLG